MPGIYGDVLSAFSALLDTFETFAMTPLPGGGFGERRNISKVTGYIQRVLTGDAGSSDAMFNENARATLFTYSNVPKAAIKAGLYLEFDDEMYRFVHSDNYGKEGGFIAHKLQLVVGPTDRDTSIPQVDQNIADAY